MVIPAVESMPRTPIRGRNPELRVTLHPIRNTWDRYYGSSSMNPSRHQIRIIESVRGSRRTASQALAASTPVIALIEAMKLPAP